jgi:Fur family peroxide stress response transcriptional regulator
MQWLEKYKNIGMKLTPQRIAILECLEGNEEHPSAEDIFDSVREKFPTMSFATVYNTLDRLRRDGLVLELSIDPTRRRYDPDVSTHHHMICTSCGRVADIKRDFDLSVPEEEREGFDISMGHVEFYGRCPDCIRKGGS